MKLLTLWQPWASFMFTRRPAKTIETRSWSAKWRGPVAIHAAQMRPTKAVREIFRDPQLSRLLGRHLRENAWGLVDVLDSLPRGVIIGVVDLVDCQRTEDLHRWIERGLRTPLNDAEQLLGNYGPNRYAWITKNPRPLPEPIPFRSLQGLRTIDADMVAKIRAQLAALTPPA